MLGKRAANKLVAILGMNDIQYIKVIIATFLDGLSTCVPNLELRKRYSAMLKNMNTPKVMQYIKLKKAPYTIVSFSYEDDSAMHAIGKLETYITERIIIMTWIANIYFFLFCLVFSLTSRSWSVFSPTRRV